MMKLQWLRSVFCAAALLTAVFCTGCGSAAPAAPSAESTAEHTTESTLQTIAADMETTAVTTEKTTAIQTSRTTVTTAETDTETAQTAESTVSDTAATVSRATAASARQTAVQTAQKTTVTTVRTTITTTVTQLPSAADDMAQLIRKYPRGCAVLLYSMDGTTLYSYHADTYISGASLIKLPFVYYCCTQIESGAHSLAEKMTYTAAFKQGGAGVVAAAGTGKQYTVAELMDYTLRYSDNTAYYMLVHLFGAAGFNQMVSDWGYSIRISESSRYPSVTTSFMRTAMEKMQAKSGAGGGWTVAWEALNESSRSYVREALGGTDKIAVKYGSIPAQYHETCYVAGDTPYILVILSGAVNYTPDISFVKNVAACAARIVSEYAAAQTATTEAQTDTTTQTVTTAERDTTASALLTTDGT